MHKTRGATRAELVRTIRLRPYTKASGLPTFTLEIFDPERSDKRGAPIILWRLKKHDYGKTSIVFDGLREPNKWRCSGWFSVDGDEAIECCLTFASLQPGDTDQEFFDDYSPEQLEFAHEHGETLSAVNESRFRDKNGNPKKGRR